MSGLSRVAKVSFPADVVSGFIFLTSNFLNVGKHVLFVVSDATLLASQ